MPGQVAACLLLFLEEEDAFWMMGAVIEDLLPASYFSTTLLGVQTDQRVLRQLIVQYLPRLDKLLQEHDIGEARWGSETQLAEARGCRPARVPSLLRAVPRTVPHHAALVPHGLRQRGAHPAAAAHLGPVLLRGLPGAVPDHTGHAAPPGARGRAVQHEGARVHSWPGPCSANPAPCPAQEEELIQSENSASIFNTLSDIPSQMDDAELLLGEAMRLAGSLTAVAVETQRRKHLAYLIADQGQLLGTGTTSNLSQVGPQHGLSRGFPPPWGEPALGCSESQRPDLGLGGCETEPRASSQPARSWARVWPLTPNSLPTGCAAQDAAQEVRHQLPAVR